MTYLKTQPLSILPLAVYIHNLLHDLGRDGASLDYVTGHVQLLGFADVRLLSLIGQNDNYRVARQILLAHDTQQFKTVHGRHDNIQYDNIRSETNSQL